MIPQNFFWSDDARPDLPQVKDYTQLSTRTSVDFEVLQLQDPNNSQRWTNEALIATSEALRFKGVRVIWMMWARTDEAYCVGQINYLSGLYERFIPNGVQWDAEEQYEATGPWQKCAGLLNDGLNHLNSQHNCAPEYSITATTKWPQPLFEAHIEDLLSREMFTHGYAMAYAFYNTSEGHWSQNLPQDVTETVHTIAMAWIDAVKRGLIDQCYIGLAAHFQAFPPEYNLPGLEGMMQCIGEVYRLSDENPGCIAGQGWWSRKHLVESEDKQTVVYNASQDPRGGRELTPLPEAPGNAVKQLQQVLTDAGYDPGPIDGVDGPQTRAAVNQYGQEKARVTSAQEGGADELIEEVYF